ncbi:MAG: hypothetical protein HC828_02160 [Blastochloris sp.]|nr:hypothetical protein [Blastochloris sp.]
MGASGDYRGIVDEGRLITLPNHLHERRAAQRRVAAHLTQRLGREPNAAEIGAALGWSHAKMRSVAADLRDAGSLNLRLGDDADSNEVGALFPDTRYDPEHAALEGSLRADMRQAMEQLLSAREQQFVRAHFGLDSGQPLTLDQIGQEAGLTRERVRQVIVGALTKLREAPSVQAYGALLRDS